MKEAAEAEPAQEVETKSTGEKYTPSKTLLAKYEEAKNKRGQITMRTAEEFVEQLFLDHKYTKNEQGAMQDLRDLEVFTEAAKQVHSLESVSSLLLVTSVISNLS